MQNNYTIHEIAIHLIGIGVDELESLTYSFLEESEIKYLNQFRDWSKWKNEAIDSLLDCYRRGDLTEYELGLTD